MVKPKPLALREGEMTKSKRKTRQVEEERLKGVKPIPSIPPESLCERGKAVYTEIIDSLPSDFLCGLDETALTACADSIAGMERCREIINREGILVDNKQNQALLALSKYSDIFRRYSDDLGLSPASRGKLGYIKSQQLHEESDPLLKILNGGKKPL